MSTSTHSSRAAIVATLQGHRAELAERFDVQHLALFGSAAADTLKPESDVDILVSFEGPATFDRFMELKFRLEELLGRRVDLVTAKALRPRLAEAISAELVDVA